MKAPFTLFLLLALSVSLHAQFSLTDSLQAHYPFNNGSMNDVTGNGHNGTNLGAVSSVGYHGDANGSYSTGGGAIRINNHATITNYSEYSLCAWVYPTSHPTHATIVAKVSPNRDFDLKLSNGRPSIHFAQGSTYWTSTASSAISFNQWAHIVGTWDGTFLNIYVNGNLENSVNHQGNNPPWSGGLMHIGSLTGTSERLQGRIDEVRVYNRALTDCEIVKLYDSIPIDTSVIFLIDSLMANDSISDYQWINCDSGTAVQGATGRYFKPTVPGNYAVILEKLICSDTSGCHYIKPPPPNMPPEISSITGATICMNASFGPASFIITDEDSSTVTLMGISSNTTLIQNSKITFSGSGNIRTVKAVPEINQTGNTTITVVVSDIHNESDSTMFNVKVDSCIQVGMRQENMNEITLAPNPVDNTLLIRGTHEVKEYRILNANGQLIDSGAIAINSEIDLSDLFPGMYLLLIDQGEKAIRFIKK